MGKPVEQETQPTDITPPTENKDIESFFNYLEETIQKEEAADQQAVADAELAKQEETPAVITDPNFEATSGTNQQ